MNRILASLFVASLIGTVGCGNSGSAGGPGTGKQPLIGQADETFNLTTSSMTVKQGEAAQGTIGIKRGTNFSQDVALNFTELPKGVTLDPTSPMIKGNATDAKFTLNAADDAVVGEYTIKLAGHPGKGGDATNEFKLTVAKKDSFTISMPFWTTALKQGESKDVTLSINRQNKFDQDVTLKFDALPKGVTIEPATAVIKNGETEAKFTLKATDDASLGAFSIMATGHPTKGADASHEFKFNIAKK